MKTELKHWGWDSKWESALKHSPTENLWPARVTAVFPDKSLLQFGDAELFGEVTGKFRHEAKHLADFPSVGDWVCAEKQTDFALIHKILPRRTFLSRKSAGQQTEEQMLAANVDFVFITTAFDGDFNQRRIERYAVPAKQAGMEPVVVINKSDLAAADDPRFDQAHEVNPGGSVHKVSAQTGEGLQILSSYLIDGKTGVFLGSSGVGKSSLLNALMNEDIQETQTIRVSDSKGRHTTTTREMFKLPDGGLVIDTPGIREIQLWADETALADAFSDITNLSRSCQFKDCRHQSEPGCAVQLALKEGTLSPDRYKGYVKLQKELAYLKRKKDPEQSANSKRRWKEIHKQIKEITKRDKHS